MAVDLTKGVGEQRSGLRAVVGSLRLYLPDRVTVRMVGAGSLVLARLVWSRLPAPAGLRGFFQRLAIVGAGGYVVMCVQEQTTPFALPVAGAAWVLAALAVAPGSHPAEAPAEAAPQTPAESPAGTFEEPPLVALVRDLIGDGTGVHLQELYPAMREAFPGLAQAADEDLRQLLAEYHIRVARTVRSRGVAGRSGVRPDGLPSPTPPRPLSAPLSAHGDAGQHPVGEQPESPRRGAGEPLPDGVTISPDPARTYHRVTRR
ncbi:hypothetical protein [Peterkaempfera griseoplana]|uniref:hypothetical protein n=1 Tax=Peterkaempfera griseoplana TaxID=66896 RepID=UPI0006E22EBB|nr:hypothetical protein [Peterkaempfera griseoplana]